jgi:putative chitinase
MRLDTITAEILRQIMPNLPRAQREEYAPLLTEAMREFDITTELRAAAFLAQLAHESNELTRWEENLNYSAKRLTQVWPGRFPTIASAQPFAKNPQALAERVYGGRMGNRQPGDGYKHRGRFPIQATGADMYRAAAGALRLPALADDPDAFVNDRLVGFRVSAWIFAVEKGCNPLADRRQFRAITVRINGGTNGLEDRVKYYDRALRALPDDFKLSAAAPVIADDTVPDIVEEADDEDDRQPGGAALDAVPGGAMIAGAEIGELASATLVQKPPTPVEGGGAHDAPVVVQPTAPAKERSTKSLTSAIAAIFAALATPYMMFKDELHKMLEDAPTNVIFVIGIVAAAAVLIYWKYQDRQTRLDIADRSHASDQTQLAMKLTADPNSINVTTQPNVTPAPPPPAGDGGREE